MANTHKIEYELERIRKESDALLALLITPERGYVATDSRLTPQDAVETLRNEIPSIAAFLRQETSR